MQRPPIDFSAQGWGRVIVYTVLGTLLCVVAALIVDSFNFGQMNSARRLQAIATDIALPIVLAVPLLLFFTSKLRDLAIAHEKLAIYASTDSLTGLLNRGAFTTLVDAYLTEVLARDNHARGALLVLDADNFKAINDRFGHDRGDEALKIIASSIRSMIRAPDLVGRIGGEEFGVFLPGSNPDQARAVAERIRRTISEAEFAPDGAVRRLSVSVGGALFERPIGFGDLFRTADQQLYLAKQAGRNQVAVSPVAAYGTITLAPAT